jgi:hypothetical protein
MAANHMPLNVSRKTDLARKRPLHPGIVNTSVKFPEGVHKTLRIEAAEQGITFNEVVITRLLESIAARRPRSGVYHDDNETITRLLETIRTRLGKGESPARDAN